MKQIERALGSNICRCTGYRPILQTFKKYAVDAPNPKTLAIEELSISGNSGCCSTKSGCCSSKKTECCSSKKSDCSSKETQDSKKKSSINDWCMVSKNEAQGKLLHIKLKDNTEWYRPTYLKEVFEIFAEQGTESYMLVAGNTEKGVSPRLTYPKCMIDITGIEELRNWYVDQNLVIGATCSMAEMIKRWEEVKGNEGFSYLEEFIMHMDEVAHVSVRNIMPRSQSVHALVNAGFCFKVDENNVIRESRITIGALSHHFTRAHKTERYLVGKNLYENETLQGGLESLKEEMVIVEDLNEPSVEYRRILALGLFYKCFLSLCPQEKVNSYYRSGAVKHRETRPVSEAHQIYDTNPSLWPITKPLPKNDGLLQCSGEAQYTDDIPLMPNELFAAFVLAQVPLGTIEHIDTTKAMAYEGVVAFFSAKDIPGNNSFIPAPNSYNLADEELFCGGEVKYFNQPIGMVVCKTQAIANYAATLVEVTYTNVRKPVIDINEAIKDPNRVSVFQSVKAKSKGDDVYKVIKGNNTIYGQYHWTMETNVCVVRPNEEGLEVHAATQWLDLAHQGICRALKLDQNK
ncbi:uncharacterized protein LOC128198880 [Bicyclus anynana]|uniref:Uncharacterized protein LOC128198880 n=1 Tax=Bicyclus anynana TaxID=110368 RepID=A0ABM3LTB2_BICAN|nr:uncharacterized protein LOC128198880 [Bicyclus anynana]